MERKFNLKRLLDHFIRPYKRYDISGRTDTTQGTDMTKRLIATELINAINTTAANSNVPSQLLHQPTKIAVDNQAICTGISSTKAGCTFLINIHN